MTTARKLISELAQGCGDIDEEWNIVIYRRNEHGCILELAKVPITYINHVRSALCIEEPNIKWEPIQ